VSAPLAAASLSRARSLRGTADFGMRRPAAQAGTPVAEAACMARHAWLLASLLGLPLALAWGCNSVSSADGDVGDECGDPPPPQMESECPPAWQCIDGDWVDTAGACPEPECPELEPSDSGACSEIGQQCSYWHEDEPCGEEQGYHDYQCGDGGWTLVGTRCSPPPECPFVLPVAGTDCSEYPLASACPFEIEGECGPTMALAQCIDDGAGPLWNVIAADSCDCSVQADPTSCEEAGCRWLVPGCGDSPLWQTGCFPAEDCTADSCGEGYVCAEVSVNPCWNEACDACGAPAAVCDILIGTGEEGS
jgi:hypothetical protein